MRHFKYTLKANNDQTQLQPIDQLIKNLSQQKEKYDFDELVEMIEQNKLILDHKSFIILQQKLNLDKNEKAVMKKWFANVLETELKNDTYDFEMI